MRILPVIDLLGGCVVRGVAGRRETYQPIRSRLCGDASPGAIAAALVGAFGFTEMYVADLDAIAGRQPAWGDYDRIAAAGLRLWIDAGVGDAERARQLAAVVRSEHRWVIGLESLSDANALNDIASQLPQEQLVFSLDLRAGQPITSVADWASVAPLNIAAAAHNAGCRSFIVLDLTRVGMGEGTGTSDLCRAVRQRWPDATLIGGGGVAGQRDLEALAADGLDYALVASALHDGRLTPADVSHWR